MVKVLILLGVVVLLWWLLRPRPSARGSAQDAAGPARAPREIVACTHCGVHVPRDEALPGPGESFYCCEAHRRSEHSD